MEVPRKFFEGLIVLAVSVGVVAVLSFVTNEMKPQWDMVYYTDMAEHGLIGNHGLVAPFAFRPAAPLMIGAISRVTGWSIVGTFRVCARLAGVVLIVGCFMLARRLGAAPEYALWIAFILPLNIYYLKWPFFAVSMVDIYAYPLFLLTFYLLWVKQLWLCIAVAALGLFFKEFFLVPLLTAAGIWTCSAQGHWRRVVWPLTTVGAILFACFILPRTLIHVVRSFQDVDPAHPETLLRLITYPLSWRRWFNILFAYIAVWLPVLMLLNRPRLAALRKRLVPQVLLLLVFLSSHLLLVIYGGTNIVIFVSYSLPVALLAMCWLLEDGRPHVLELVLVTVAVIIFNRSFSRIPLPEEGLYSYLKWYGGYYHLVTMRSVFRFGEAFAFMGSAVLLRYLLSAKNDLKLNKHGNTVSDVGNGMRTMEKIP